MNLKLIFLVLAILSLVIGIGMMFLGEGYNKGVAIVEGLAKGMAGVFFILYYILMLLGKQPTDKTTH